MHDLILADAVAPAAARSGCIQVGFGTLLWMDSSLVFHANHLLQMHDGLEDVVLRFEQGSQIMFVAALAAMFLFAPAGADERLRRSVSGALGSAALAVALAAVIARLVDRARPFVAHPHGVHLFAPHAADPGFPSDHATAAFAIAMAVFLRDRVWGSLLLAVAALVAVGRVAIGVHYPTDVLAGAALGCVAALICFVPRIRALTDAVADWAGAIVDRALRRPRTSARTV